MQWLENSSNHCNNLSLLCAVASLSALGILYVSTLLFPSAWGVNVDRLEHWMRHCRKQEERFNSSTSESDGSKPQEESSSDTVLQKMTPEDVQAAVTLGRPLTILNGFVLDLRLLRHPHPGGDFLHLFVGRDVTPWFLVQHAKNEKALRWVRHCTVARLVESRAFLCEADQAYLDLHEKLRLEGIFDVPRAWLIRGALEVLVPLVLGYSIYFGHSRTWGFLIMLMGILPAGWFFHDIMHYSLFPKTRTARWWGRWPLFILLGVDFVATGDIHSIHHAFPNVVGRDSAMIMPPLSLHPAQGPPAVPTGGQSVIFYGFLAWIVLPYYAVASFVSNRKNTLMLVLSAGRLFLTYHFWEYLQPLVVCNVVGFAWFAILGSLNHFHKDMALEEDVFPVKAGKPMQPGKTATGPSFVALQSVSIQNTDSTDVWDWLSGHLTLHTEHHWFPHAPRCTYREQIRPHVKKILRRYGLPYDVCPQWEAVRRFNALLWWTENRCPKSSLRLVTNPKQKSTT